MIITMGSVKIEVSRVQNTRMGDDAQRAHEQNALEQAIREARLAHEIAAAAYLNGFR
ncbi:MAG: hypothetical protein BWY92_00561 [Firmicutes bacterium ADurb.BinA052]|nr:MAG: hypothetical protein BWY92_00561 [Firmicutes bacterium ADurb.BinA052]